MVNVSIVIPNGNPSLVNIEGTRQILAWVNTYSQSKTNQEVFNIQLVGSSCKEGRIKELSYDVIVFDEVGDQDLIIIPAVHGSWETVRKQNQELIEWVKSTYEAGTQLVSFCVGTFLLAEAGVLDGKRCSTHWEAANEFKSLFPHVLLEDEKMLVEDDRVFSSGGAYAFTNLLVYLIERFADFETAIVVAKTFMIDLSHNSQSFFSIFNGLKTHGDASILSAQKFIEAQYERKLPLNEIAQHVNMSERTLQRRFKERTHYTPIQYLQYIRIEMAKRLLTIEKKTVDQIMWDMGYEDANHFRELFRNITGINPHDYRARFLLHKGL